MASSSFLDKDDLYDTVFVLPDQSFTGSILDEFTAFLLCDGESLKGKGNKFSFAFCENVLPYDYKLISCTDIKTGLIRIIRDNSIGKWLRRDANIKDKKYLRGIRLSRLKDLSEKIGEENLIRLFHDTFSTIDARVEEQLKILTANY